MSGQDIVRAWKDPAYRASLSAEEAAGLPTHPAGAVELTDDELRNASGLAASRLMTTAWFCTLRSFGGWTACCP